MAERDRTPADGGALMAEKENSQELNEDCSFVWDEASRLYFHARTGFYHDPNAGWYYSSKDGLFYKFEDGNYVPLKHEAVDVDGLDGGGTHEIFLQDESHSHRSCDGEDNCYLVEEDKVEGCHQEQSVVNEATPDNEGAVHHASEDLQPPSEWLEDTLIELYLAGYSKLASDAGGESSAVMTPPEACDGNDFRLSSPETNDAYELEEGEWIPEDLPVPHVSNEDVVNQDEEKWQAQYGQVIQSREEPVLEFRFVDLWDWAVVRGSGKDGNGQVVRLVGRLVKRSAKLHPSMPAGGGFLKTAPICQVRFDLVRVRTGKIYKLRSPSASYLNSVTSYDSSNPTKDWGFPELVAGGEAVSFLESTKNSESKRVADKEPDHFLASQEHKGPGYKDRAAARRMLHHGYGVGPGQKNLLSCGDDVGSSGASVSTEEAAAEALHMSFGTGSFARKVLERMGWKEGEGLGRSVKGSVEPVQAVGNVGSAGLGWPQRRTKRR